MSAAESNSEAPKWLDAEEQRAWFAFVTVAVRLEPALDSHLRRTGGISHFEYTVLATLSEAPQRTLRMSELAFLADGSLSRLSQVIVKLEKRAFVVREPDPTDGRSTLASLTPAGFDKVVAVAPAHVREVRRLVFDPLTRAQVRQLSAISRRIVAALGPMDQWRPPSAG